MNRKPDKLKLSVHYIIAKCGDPRKLGATKLNKILWFADSFAYVYWGESITGSKYIRKPYGPVPKNIEKTKKQLIVERKINVQSRKEKYEPVLYRNLNSPDVSHFPENHIGLFDALIDEICNEYTASEISRVSHDDIWKALIDGEEIPLETLLVSEPGNYSNEAISWANQVVKNHGL